MELRQFIIHNSSLASILLLAHLSVGKLRPASLIIMPTCLILFFLLAEGHIGQPCNALLRMCLPWSGHMYCDDKNICRCRPDYPVQIGDHSCRKGRRVGERCTTLEECQHTDSNSYCTQTPFSSQCDCLTGFLHDKIKQKCVPEGKFSRKPGSGSTAATSLLIPSAAGFIMACISLLCCCILVWHNLCRAAQLTPEETWREIHGHHAAVGSAGSRSSHSHRHRGSSSTHSRNQTHSSLARDRSVPLPSYESAFYDSRHAPHPFVGMADEPPPSYDEAIKQSAPHIMTTTDNNQNQATEHPQNPPSSQQSLQAPPPSNNESQIHSQPESQPPVTDANNVSINIIKDR